MENRLINREIRRVSNFSSLPVLILMVLQQVLIMLASFVINVLIRNGIMIDDSVRMIIIYTVFYVICGSIAAFTFYRTRSKSTGLRLIQAFCKPQKSAGWILKWYVIIIALIYSANVITMLFRTLFSIIFHFEPNSPSADFGDGALGAIGMVLALSIYAPLFEEIIFRSAVYRNTEVMGQPFAIIFSGILFALFHMNYAQTLYTFVMGCGMAFLVAKTRSIIPSIIFHFALNTSSLLLTLFSGLGNSIGSQKLADNLENSEFLMDNLPRLLIMDLFGLAVIGIIITGIVLFIVELVRNRRKKIFMEGIFPVKGLKKTAIFLSAPVTIITLALGIIGTVINFFIL